MTTWSADDAYGFFEKTYCQESSPDYRDLALMGGAEEIVPGAVFQFVVDHRHYQKCSARMYCGFENELGGRLWLQEAQSLVRFTATPHPALPRVRDGFFSDERGVGVVLTESRGDPLTLDLTQQLRKDPAVAFRVFSLAVDAVRTLHAHGLIHRDIWRESFEWAQYGDAAPEVRLFGFELSAFVASLLDPVWRRNDEDSSLLEQYLKRGGWERRLFRAPEIQIAERDLSKAELTYRSDMFSLGVCGFEWFVGDLPPELAARDDDRPDAVETATILDRRIAQARHVPTSLRSLLREMIRLDPRTRPTAAEAVNMLVRLQDDIVSSWSTDTTDRPYVLTIAPDFVQQFVQIEEWQTLSADPTIRFDELRTLIVKDLRNSLFVHEPQGAERYVQGGDRAAEKTAVWVLVGNQGVYFCDEYRAARGSTRHVVEWALHVKYVVDRRDDRLRNIAAFPLQRRIRSVIVVDSRSAEVHPTYGQGRHPRWKPLLDAVRVAKREPDWMQPFRNGLEWWMKVQAANLQIHKYAYRRVNEDRKGHDLNKVRLVWDVQRDQRWIERDVMRDLLAKRLNRPDFGAFFDTLFERNLGEEVTWLADDNGWPTRRDRPDRKNSGRVLWRNPHEVEVVVEAGDPPPVLGWLSPAEDNFSETLLRRQISAASSLFQKRHLMQALYDPGSIPGSRSIWDDVLQSSDESNDEKGKKLKGRAPEIVRDILAHFPFYALQGPPGTGKTTVIATAIGAYLKKKPGARILISAQSHYALDELAERLMPIIDCGDVTAIRVGSDKTLGQIRELIKEKYLDVRQAAKRVADIEAGRAGRRSGSREKTASTSPVLHMLAARWQKVARSSLYEIQDRLWRGANIVFATCGACTEDLLGVHDEFDAFDWVIVEEAARAWPVELCMPLVIGHRWALIGDHNQLPPFGKDTILDLYTACLESNRPEVNALVEDNEAFKSTLNLFGHLFETPRTITTSRNRRPVDQLDMQFRMDDRILRVVRHAFYPNIPLKSADELRTETPRHGLERPAFIRERALVWLDTGQMVWKDKQQGTRTGTREERRWKNRGEVVAIDELLRAIRPSLFARIVNSPHSLALLSPYHQQNNLLASELDARLTPFIHTTDSFQGQEAEIVIVSLVRTNDAPEEDTINRIGHVASEQRANVLLSRARSLLIVVGDFEHYSNTSRSVWPKVCEVISELGARVRIRNIEDVR